MSAQGTETTRPKPVSRQQAAKAAETHGLVIDSYGAAAEVTAYSDDEDMVWLALAAGLARRPRREVYPVDTWTVWAAQRGWPGVSQS